MKGKGANSAVIKLSLIVLFSPTGRVLVFARVNLWQRRLQRAFNESCWCSAEIE